MEDFLQSIKKLKESLYLFFSNLKDIPFLTNNPIEMKFPKLVNKC